MEVFETQDDNSQPFIFLEKVGGCQGRAALSARVGGWGEANKDEREESEQGTKGREEREKGGKEKGQ